MGIEYKIKKFNNVKNSLVGKILAYGLAGSLALGYVHGLSGCEKENGNVKRNIETSVKKEKIVKETLEKKTDEVKKKIVEEVLDKYGYTVISVETEFEFVKRPEFEFPLGNKEAVGVNMYPKNSVEEINKQVGAGFVALYSAWPDKKLYGVGLNGGIYVCVYFQLGDILRDHINGKVSRSYFNSSLEIRCE